MKKNLADYLSMPIQDATELELFNALLNLVTDSAAERGYNEGRKKLYYISAEFLIGKLLSNNLINLGLYDDVRAELEAAGRSLETLEEFETEPSLGNGGLGRLAACFIDSCATLGLPADGIGLAYHCGLFRQTFVNGRQHEIPDRWLVWGHESWMRRTGVSYRVPFGDFELPSVMYEIDVTGYDGKCGRLRLFDVDTIDERVIRDQISFDKKDIARSMTLFLYPDDSDEAGRMLRVYQEYFMVSNAAQLILDECVARGSDLHDLADYAAIQINDTHPTMVIPELIRLLGMRGIGIDEAIRIVTAACGYTNHTILAEALEKWPMSFLEKAVPQLVPIIEELDRRISAAYDDPFVQIIDGDGCVHMANIDIHFSHSTNGVAALHTEILKKSELRPFYEIYPEKFNNKTNGITFRRWLKSANPGLSGLITGRIGNSWIRNADELEKLLAWSDDESFLRSLAAVKKENKVRFAAWLYDHQGTKIDPDSVFDVHIKRMHEYKRQLLGDPHLSGDPERQNAGPPGDGDFRRKGRAGLHHCQGHHPRDPDAVCPDRVRSECAALATGHHDRKLQYHRRGKADPRLRYLRADLACVQGSQRHQQHEVHAERRRDPRHHGRRERGDRRSRGAGQYLHVRRKLGYGYRPLRARHL